MSDVELVHPVPVEDVDAYTRALAVTFLHDPDSEEARRFAEAMRITWQPDRRWAARADGIVVGTLGTLPLRMTVPGPGGGTREVPADGLTSVTVSATHRRRGLLTAMLTESLAAAKERGDPVSILIAAEWPIYGRYGYTPTEQFSIYTLRSRALRDGLEGSGKGAVRLVTAEELVALAPGVFDRARRQRAGNIDRPAAWWRLNHGVDGHPWIGRGKRPNLVVHETDGRADGFAVWTSTRDFDLTGDLAAVAVSDLHADNDDAYRDLWAYLAGIDAVEEITLRRRPVDEPIRWVLGDGRALRRTYSGDGLWLRLLDVPAALSARTYAVDGALTLEVVDRETGGHAQGTVRLEGGPDGASCTPAAGATPDLRLSQRALAASYLGGHALRELSLTGWVDELTPGALARADAMFRTPLAPWCATGF